jgi:hypothetical protein
MIEKHKPKEETPNVLHQPKGTSYRFPVFREQSLKQSQITSIAQGLFMKYVEG